MTYEIIDSSEGIKRLEGPWNALLERSERPDVLHSYQWYASWSESFVPSGDMLIAAAWEDLRLSAVLPLMKQRYRAKGPLAVKAVRSMTNRNSALFDLLSDRPSAELLGSLFSKALDASRGKMIVLEKIHEDSLILKHLEEAAGREEFFYLVRPVSEGWTVRIDASFDSFFNTRAPKFKKNMRAAERKSLDRGRLDVSQPSGPEDLDQLLDRGFILQSNGWKGREGSAVMQNEQVRRFYKKLAAACLDAGWLRYMLLTSNGEDLSFIYCLGAFGAIHALEIGMDERFRNIGAGMVAAKRMLEQVFREERFTMWDFGEGQDRWKKDWSTERALVRNVFVFPKTPVGALLYGLARRYDRRHPFRPSDSGDAGTKGGRPDENGSWENHKEPSSWRVRQQRLFAKCGLLSRRARCSEAAASPEA